MANKKLATLEKLSALHGAVADVLAEGLEACAPTLKEHEQTGEMTLIHYDARLVGQAMTFLKDNNISVDLDDGDDGLEEARNRLEKMRIARKAQKDPFSDIPYQ